MSEEREVLELDAVIVGAGPGGLACAYHLQGLINTHNEQVASGAKEGKALDEVMIAVLEKGGAVGDQVLSGAVMDPKGLRELMPDYEAQGCPGIDVTGDDVLFLTAGGKFKSPITPPGLGNHGNRIVSINRLVRWLGEKVEEREVDIFSGFPASDLLVEDGKVVGVRTGDKGVDKDGNPKPNHEPGMDVRAPVTILAEGSRGSLTKKLVKQFDLDRGQNPQVYATGVKEVWRVPGCDAKNKGKVIHTMGYPIGRKDFGGGFIYYMGDDLISIGFCTGLDYKDPTTDPHRNFQRMKEHPYIKELLAGGELVRYGAKTIPEGGWFSRPKSYVEGCLLIGDCGSNLNPARLKGIHMAIKTGMMAAETAFDAMLKEDASETVLKEFESKIENSWVKKELYSVRNFHQSFEKGMPWAVLDLGLQTISGGRSWGFIDRVATKAGHEHMQKGIAKDPVEAKFDGKLTFDKLTDVYNSGTIHEEDQPCHLVVTVDPNHCETTCKEEYGNPCQHFCPAQVYEMVDETEGGGGRETLRVNFSNCVHCKTCDVADPYQAIEWVTPEGGGGPVYTDL